jgi:hypothetical protein
MRSIASVWRAWAAQEGRCHATLADGKAIPFLVVLGRRIMQLYIIILYNISPKKNVILIFLGAKTISSLIKSIQKKTIFYDSVSLI